MSRRRILCVDGDAAALASLAIILQSQGYDVMTALSGEEALKVCSHQAFDGAVVECWLPDIQGVELARRIKQSGAATRVILQAALASPEVDAILTKPVSPEQLLNVLRQYLES